MNKSLLVLLALAIVGTNVMAAKENSCWCWKRCDGRVAKKWCGCEKKEKKAPRAKKEKKSCCWSCNSKKETKKAL